MVKLIREMDDVVFTKGTTVLPMCRACLRDEIDRSTDLDVRGIIPFVFGKLLSILIASLRQQISCDCCVIGCQAPGVHPPLFLVSKAFKPHLRTPVSRVGLARPAALGLGSINEADIRIASNRAGCRRHFLRSGNEK